MRTVLTICLVGFVAGSGMAIATGDGTRALGADDQGFIDVKGTIVTVRPEANELVVSENVKNWTFRLAKEAKVFVNAQESTLAKLKPGDEATVTFDRQGPMMIATVVLATRK